MKDKSNIIGIEKHVRITDTDISDQIDRLKTQDSVRELKDLFERKSKDGLPLRQEVIKKLKREHYDEVIILGHSLSDVDKLVLDAINKDAKFVCYYFDKPDYDRKLKEIEKLKWSCELIASDKLYL